MFKTTIVAAVAAVAFAAHPAIAQEGDKAAKWCNDAHMAQMEKMVGEMADDAKKTATAEHFGLSKAAFEKKDMAGCVEHMEMAHKAMM